MIAIFRLFWMFTLGGALACFISLSPVVIEAAVYKSDLSYEDSIIPQMEKWEKIENLSAAKYSKEQFQEICWAVNHSSEFIRAASFNVLFNRYDEDLQKAHRWPNRFSRVVNVLKGLKADIIGLQELDPGQAADFLPQFSQEYEFFVKDNRDGELNGILYRRERFELVEGKIWYMTPTPEVVSRETLTMARLRDRLTGKEVAVFNAHLAFAKIEKRHFQAKFVASIIASYAQSMAVLFMGDMNTFPHRLDLEKLPFYDGDYVQKIIKNRAHLREARQEAILGHIGPLSSYTNHDEEAIPFTGTGTAGVYLDHIFVSAYVNVVLHAIEPARVGGNFPSDHMPVVIDFLIADAEAF